MKIGIGDFINDLERPGACGTVTGINVFAERDRQVVTYTMDIFASNNLWAEKARRAGTEYWHTGRWQIASPTRAISDDASTYCEAVTQ